MTLAIAIRQVDSVPDTLEGAERVGLHSVARPGALLRQISGIGRFLALDGKAIDYMPDPDAEAEAVRAVLDGAMLGAVLHQRGDLPLHASTLVAPAGDRAVAIAGGSGAGKSTTAFALARAGWTLLSDDLTRVTIVNGVPTAWPGRSRLRLLDNVCMDFDLDTAGLSPAPNWPGKFVLDLPQAQLPTPLAAVVVLDPAAPPELECFAGGSAARLLAAQTYRLHYVAALGQARRHLELIAATVARARVMRIGRAGDVFATAAAIMGTC